MVSTTEGNYCGLVKFLRVGSLVRELGAELTENAEGRDWVIFLLGLLGSPCTVQGPLPELGCPRINWPRAFGGRVPIPAQLCPSRLGVTVVSLLQKGCGFLVVGKGQSRDS